MLSLRINLLFIHAPPQRNSVGFYLKFQYNSMTIGQYVWPQLRFVTFTFSTMCQKSRILKVKLKQNLNSWLRSMTCDLTQSNVMRWGLFRWVWGKTQPKSRRTLYFGRRRACTFGCKASIPFASLVWWEKVQKVGLHLVFKLTNF